ncbi:hypothetical protein BH23GEM1_BH23GEM1_03700 [soil metagenome]
MRIPFAFFSLALAACSDAEEGFSWGPVAYGANPPDARAAAATLPPRGDGGCADVVVVEHAEARYAAWWEAGEDGGSVLMLARSPDGGATWEAPIVADDRDAGGLRCSRPPPSLFSDETSEYLHVSYHISPPGSPGVYFTHSMKASVLGTSGEGVLHMPVPVTHGERPVLSSVAGRGDTVVVAFEDPNSARPRILLAYSTGAGHVFEAPRAVSPAGAAATVPRVTLTADSVRVQWMEALPDGSFRAASRSARLP